MLVCLSGYVSNVAAGDSEIINRAGMGVGTIGGPAQAASRPDNLRLKDAHTSGSIKALWKKDKNAKAYMVYIAIVQTPDTNHHVASGRSASLSSLSALPEPPVQPGTTGYMLYDICLTSKIVMPNAMTTTTQTEMTEFDNII